MATTTLFTGLCIPVENKSLLIMANRIMDGAYRTEVEIIRSLYQEGKKAEADKLKKQLMAFTPSATFKGGRKMEYLDTYSQFVILDLDKLSAVQLSDAITIAREIPYTFFAFISPSGNGIKILVEVTTQVQEHESAYKQVADYYERELNIPIDRSGKDVTRLCFVSYDPGAFKNISNQKFKVAGAANALPLVPREKPKLIMVGGEYAIKEPVQTLQLQNTADKPGNTHNTLFKMCQEYTDQKQAYTEGSRNNYIHLLACNTNRAGIPYDDALTNILAGYDLDPAEIKATVASVYKNQGAEFASFTNFALPVAIAEPPEAFEDKLLNMPFLPDNIFDNLPKLLTTGCTAFDTKRERDIFLIGAITVLSGCLTSVEGCYDRKTIYPNLNCFIIAPAASGKGALVHARTLAQAYHDKIIKESMEAQKHYDAALQQYKANLRFLKKGEVSTEEEPVKPPFKVVYIPGNSSSASVIQLLMDSEEQGIICETEADTIGNSFKQDWGGYSYLLRQAFHHESITLSRKTNKEYLEIKLPRLSVALSGTPAQVQGLISFAEDGLFSRFIFYTFKVEQEWRSPAPKNGRPNLTEHFKALSAETLQMIEFLKQYPFKFDIQQHQWDMLDKQFSKNLQHVTLFVAEEASSSVKRLGLITYRIAMILTAIRKFEDGLLDNIINCEDSDFNTAMLLAEVFQQHAMLMYGNLPKTEKMIDKSIRIFFEKLPQTFQRKQAIEIAKTIKIEERTADKYLTQLLKAEKLTQPKYGWYETCKGLSPTYK